jgi:predicted DsbA family dithiol-disulfide isomerase
MEDWTGLYIQNQQDQTRLLNALNEKKFNEALNINDRMILNTRAIQECIIQMQDASRATHSLAANPSD